MQAGKMRDRITVQSPTVALNPYKAGQQASWQDVASVWAQVMSASGGAGAKLVSGAGLDASQVSHVVSIRYPGTAYVVSPGYRIVYHNGTQDHFLNVLKGIVNIDSRNRELQIMCWEINPSEGGVA